MTGKLFVGTSGFAYKEWKGHFYAKDLKDREMLPFYGSKLPSVEINYTFRRFPTETTCQRWYDLAPDGFRLALKAHGRITHTKRLRDAETDVSEFLGKVKLLGDHLGPILFQCPPTLQYDPELIESFLDHLPRVAPFAFEFRHESWNAAHDLLREHGVAWCTAETETQKADRLSIPAEPFAYLRLRLEDYTEEDIAEWAKGIAATLEDGKDVYAYFKHEEGAAAPRFAQQLQRLLAPDVSRAADE